MLQFQQNLTKFTNIFKFYVALFPPYKYHGVASYCKHSYCGLDYDACNFVTVDVSEKYTASVFRVDIYHRDRLLFFSET